MSVTGPVVNCNVYGGLVLGLWWTVEYGGLVLVL